MNDEKQKGLRKIDFMPNLPVGFNELSDHEKLEIVKKIQEQDIEVRKEVMKKIGKSRVAEHDLYTAIDVIQQLDQEKKSILNIIREKPAQELMTSKFVGEIQSL